MPTGRGTPRPGPRPQLPPLCRECRLAKAQHRLLSRCTPLLPFPVNHPESDLHTPPPPPPAEMTGTRTSTSRDPGRCQDSSGPLLGETPRFRPSRCVQLTTVFTLSPSEASRKMGGLRSSSGRWPSRCWRWYASSLCSPCSQSPQRTSKVSLIIPPKNAINFSHLKPPQTMLKLMP